MISWKHASPGDHKRFKAIKILLSKHSQLLEFLFQSELPLLNEDAEDLIEQARAFSSGEFLLIRLALDIWSKQGDVFFWEILATLDSRNTFNVSRSIEYLSENECQFSSSILRQLEMESSIGKNFPKGLMRDYAQTRDSQNL